MKDLWGILTSTGDGAGPGDEIAASKIGDFLTTLKGDLRRFLAERLRSENEEHGKIESALRLACIRMTEEFSVAQREDKVPSDYKPWEVAELTALLKRFPGVNGPRDQAAINARVAVTSFLSGRLTPLFSDAVRNLKKAMADELLQVKPIPALAASLRSGPADDQLFQAMADRLPGYMPKLKDAFNQLAKFGFSYTTEFLPLIREQLYPLDPDCPRVYDSPDGMGSWAPEGVAPTDYNAIAVQLRGALDSTVFQILNETTGKSENVYRQWNRIVFAVFEDFVDRVLWSDEVEQEWRKLLWEHRRSLWADEYASQDEATAAGDAWRDRVATLSDTLKGI